MTLLRCPRPRPGATTRLVCFAHAGGSAVAYREWPALLPDSVELHGVQLPGRADRFAEPFPESLDALAAEIAGALAPLLDRRVALFGHSMGALLAYEVTRLLEAQGLGPVRLFVSGCPAPHEPRERRRFSEYDDDRLVAELARLGGSEPAVLSHRGMREVILPYVRGDFRLIEDHRSRPGPPLRTPISAFVGEADPVVTAAQAKSWEACTVSGFTLTTFPGDHFYLQPLRERVVAEVVQMMSAKQSGR
ncbi:thioesterase II family protein [Planomonospora venezuelensis]|uniref:Surfactin synthase thioesterase subunit n=1 Tax=Planomonospora venezuelensis TaxID=1999 RepID=A0A841D949_PLAVE|nr:alpha/beta fold hydrolase [Planomonospora venezuelensis]MBB5965014.1 surfactin synthase thioesterase subunit [Planomonospora venezuelensis]GIN05429.1 thioesterase [Planomonospora venezuelensis]